MGELYGMSMEEKDMLILNELEDKYKISGLMAVLYWTINRKRATLEKQYGHSNSGSRDLVDLANKIDELEQFAEKIGE